MAPKKTVTDEEKLSIIDKAIADLETKYPQVMDDTKVSTGVLPLDYVLEGGYIPSAFTEIAGESSTGKSTLALSVARALVKKGHKVLYLNFEFAQVQGLIIKMGMDKLPKSQFLVLTPSTISEGEECLRNTIYLTKLGEEPYYDHVFFDSVGGMIPDYYEGADATNQKDLVDSTDNTPALKARQIGKFFDMHKAPLKRRGVTCWFINHLSNKIETGFMAKTEKKSKGGNAVKYYTDNWVYLESGEMLYKESTASSATGSKKTSKDYYANIGTLQTTKGRGGGMMKKTECPVFFGKGVSNAYWLFLVLKNEGYISLAGSTYKCTLLEEKGVSCQGIPKMLKYLKDNQKEVINAMKKEGLWDFFSYDNGVEA